MRSKWRRKENRERSFILISTFSHHPHESDLFARTRSFLLVKYWKKFTRDIHKGMYKINTVCLPNKKSKLNTERDVARFAGYGYRSNETGGEYSKIALADVILEPAATCPQGMLCTNYAPNEPRTCDVSTILITLNVCLLINEF